MSTIKKHEIHPNSVVEESVIIEGDEVNNSSRGLEKPLVEQLPRATHVGELQIGAITIQCAVLEDGTRVLTQRAFLEALDRNTKPAKKGDFENRPAFLRANNLDPFISPDLLESLTPILFRAKGGGGASGVSYGYRAELLPQVCNVFLDADDAGQLKSNQKDVADRCRILIRGLATVGIVALVDEATGYQEERDRDALHKILEAYIAKELLPWTHRFPDEFYKEMFRLRGWQYSPMSTKGPRGPRYAGQLTNEIVYQRLPPGVLDELRNKNPIIKDGRRKYRHHQFLTDDIGNPHLEKHLAVVTALMRASANWRKFEQLLERAVPKPGELVQSEFWSDDEEPDSQQS